MEAIYEFDVQDMPVTVAVDATGESVHHTGAAGVAREDRAGAAAGRGLRRLPFFFVPA